MISAGHTVAAAMIKSQAYDAVKDSLRSGSSAILRSSCWCRRIFRRPTFRVSSPRQERSGQAELRHRRSGSTQHLTAELLRERAGIEAQAVSFRTTGELVTALLRKDIAYAVDLAHAVRGQVASAICASSRWRRRSGGRRSPTCRPSQSRALPASTCWAGMASSIDRCAGTSHR